MPLKEAYVCTFHNSGMSFSKGLGNIHLKCHHEEGIGSLPPCPCGQGEPKQGLADTEGLPISV